MDFDDVLDTMIATQELGAFQESVDAKFRQLEESMLSNEQILQNGPTASGESRIAQAKEDLAQAKAAFEKADNARNEAHKQKATKEVELKKAEKRLTNLQKRMDQENGNVDKDEDLIFMQKQLLVKKQADVKEAQSALKNAEAAIPETDEAWKKAKKAVKKAKKALKQAGEAPEEPEEPSDLETVKRQLIQDRDRYLQYKLFNAHFLLFLNELPENVRVPAVPEGLSHQEFIEFVKSNLENIDQDEDIYATVAQTNTPSTSSQSRKRCAPVEDDESDDEDEDEEPSPKRSKPLGPGVSMNRPTQSGKTLAYGGFHATMHAMKDYKGDSDSDN